ncbi:MAG: membrane dipeptidase [Candidatus Rhabdochlamydia sp.]
MKVADCHCDLLSYLAGDLTRDVNDPESKSSLMQLKDGGVHTQVFPIYTATGPESLKEGALQFSLYSKLYAHIETGIAGPLTPYLGIENASSFCDEKEPLEPALNRLSAWHQKHPLAYISFTWNEENRFGGGVYTDCGLKPDGLKLLEWMCEQNIPIDLSHASDELAMDILREVRGYPYRVIASHSNFREVHPHVRNISDQIAEGIMDQQGIIGLNLITHFVNPHSLFTFIDHIHHAKKLGVDRTLCLGADFFAEIDVAKTREHLKPFFFEGFQTAACYPKLRELLESYFDAPFIDQMLYMTLTHFLRNP